MEQIARTGVLTAGTSKDAFPYAYKNKQGDLVGYSIDMMQRISQELALELGRPVRLELKALEYRRAHSDACFLQGQLGV